VIQNFTKFNSYTTHQSTITYLYYLHQNYNSATIVTVTGNVTLKNMISEDSKYSKIKIFQGSAPNPLGELTAFPGPPSWWGGG